MLYFAEPERSSGNTRLLDFYFVNLFINQILLDFLITAVFRRSEYLPSIRYEKNFIPVLLRTDRYSR